MVELRLRDPAREAEPIQPDLVLLEYAETHSRIKYDFVNQGVGVHVNLGEVALYDAPLYIAVE